MDEDVVGRLFFGRDNAETDLVDGLLQTGFLETVAFGDAFAGPKNLVIGRKGSGKSAIRVRLAVPGVREGPPPSSHLTMRLGVKSAGSNYGADQRVGKVRRVALRVCGPGGAACC